VAAALEVDGEPERVSDALDQPRIVAAVGAAERETSGEIRIHIQPKATGGDARYVAERTFERLGMTKTALRNGVLLFIASEERVFAIVGDKESTRRCRPVSGMRSPRS